MNCSKQDENFLIDNYLDTLHVNCVINDIVMQFFSNGSSPRLNCTMINPFGDDFTTNSIQLQKLIKMKEEATDLRPLVDIESIPNV